MRKRSFLLVAGACLTTLSLTVGSAIADPVNPPGPRRLPGVGAGTTQDVMNDYGNGTNRSVPPFGGIVDGAGTKIVASYDAGPGTITTRNTPECTNIPRPSGSVDGLNALTGLKPGFPAACVSFARSAINDARPGLTYIPFAAERITYATHIQSNVPSNLSLTQLQTIYRRNVTEGCIFEPLVPQAGSSIRAFWSSVVGPFGTCVADTVGGQPIQENDGRVITNGNQLVPYSVASWIIQPEPSQINRNGLSMLRLIDNANPFNPDFPIRRTFFNVIRTDDLNNAVLRPDLIRAFGPRVPAQAGDPPGQICLHPEVLNAHGLPPLPNCGAT